MKRASLNGDPGAALNAIVCVILFCLAIIIILFGFTVYNGALFAA
jgi:hypothetical protein